MNKSEKYFLRGKASKDLSNYGAAIEDFSKAIELNPDHVDAWFERGSCFMRLKSFSAALKDFSKMIELLPAPEAKDLNEEIFFEEAYYQNGKVKADNAPIYKLTDEELIYEWQHFAVPTLGHGKISFDLGEFETALNDFDKVISSLPDVQNLFCVKYDGWDYFILDDLLDDLWLYYFDPIINPRTFDEFNLNLVITVLAYVGRGQCHKILGDDDKAQADFDATKSLGFDAEDYDSLRKTLDV